MLAEEGCSEEEDCASETPFEAALDVLDDPGTLPASAESPDAGWTAVVRRGRKTDSEIAAEFWSTVGYPTPESRF